MASNAELIDRFYSAFQQRDAETMVSCYHPEIHFSDPVFNDLHGKQAGDMWRMLCERGKDLKVEFRDVTGDGDSGSAHWEAWYTFATGNKVHNVIDASFTFADGLIIRHVDSFDLKKWAGQALGLPGRLLGGTAMMQNKIRSNAMRTLDAYQARGAAGS